MFKGRIIQCFNYLSILTILPETFLIEFEFIVALTCIHRPGATVSFRMSKIADGPDPTWLSISSSENKLLIDTAPEVKVSSKYAFMLITSVVDSVAYSYPRIVTITVLPCEVTNCAQ